MPWPSSFAIDEAAMLPGSLGEVVLDAIAAGVVRHRAGRITYDQHEPARWYPLVCRDDDGSVRVSVHRALQVAEFVRLQRLGHGSVAGIRAADRGLDLVVELPAGRRWGIVVTEARLDDIREHLRDLRSEGVAILELADTAGLRPATRTVAVLHDGAFDHFSLIGHGVRFDFRVRRRDGCVQFERDVAPR